MIFSYQIMIHMFMIEKKFLKRIQEHGGNIFKIGLISNIQNIY